MGEVCRVIWVKGGRKRTALDVMVLRECVHVLCRRVGQECTGEGVGSPG